MIYANKNFISRNGSGLITSPENAHFFRLSLNDYGSEYKNDICINLSWDGERNGEYEPYKAEYYPLASNLELRGIPKLDASNNLYYDGDEYEHTGNVARKYGVVDLGSLNWVRDSSGRFVVDLPLMKNPTTGAEYSTGFLPAKILTPNSSPIGSMSIDNTIARYSNHLLYVVCNTYNDAAAFKAAMSGVYLVYELETPTTETAAEFANPQFVDDFGTEQYVDERPVAVPVGHYTEYDQNLRAKLEMSPDSPANDGLFLMQHNNGENSYIPYISPIPALPTTNGNYTLKCVVSGGVPSLVWVEDT